MRDRTLGVLLAVAALVLACNGADPNDAPPDEPDSTEEAPDDDVGALPPEGELEAPAVDEDGNFRGQGVVVPVPEGWQVDPMALQSGLVLAAPPGDEVVPTLLAAAGVEGNPFLGFQGMDYDDALEVLRGLDPQSPPSRDEEVQLEGAERAHALLFEEVEAQPADPPLPATDQLVVLAEGPEESLAIFNYSAASDAYEDEVERLLLDEAGFDPDSEPTLPDLPDEDGLGEPEDEVG